jgi:hypothetical protein
MTISHDNQKQVQQELMVIQACPEPVLQEPVFDKSKASFNFSDAAGINGIFCNGRTKTALGLWI